MLGQRRHRDQLKFIFLAVAIGFVIVMVSVKVRNERDSFVNNIDPTFAAPTPSTDRSGTVMAGTMNPNGQAMLFNSIPTSEPCVVDGVMMPLHYKRPNRHQMDSLPANNHACVIDVTYPGATASCTNPKSTFYDVDAVKSVNIVTATSNNASSTMQCMIAFNNEVSRENLQKYATKNDMDAQKAMLVQANELLQVQNQQLGAQHQQLQTMHAELQRKTGAEAQAAQREIDTLRASLDRQSNQLNALTQSRAALEAQLASGQAANEAIVNDLRTQLVASAAAAAAAAARVPVAVAQPPPVMNARPGLKIQVSDFDASSKAAGALRFVTYGPKLYGMDLIQFPSTGWGDDSWLAGPIHLRFDGFIEIPATREYTFNLLTDDGVRMSINGESYLRDRAWKDQGSTSYSFRTPVLTAGKVPISVEYYDQGGAKELRLNWDWPAARIMAPIPADRFYYAPPSPAPPRMPVSTTTDFRNTWSIPFLPDSQGRVQPLRSFSSTRCRSENMTISFMLDITQLSGNYRNVLHVTTGPNLQRRPAIWVVSNTTRLHVCSDTVRREANNTMTVIPNVHFDTDVDIGLRIPTLIVMVYKGRNLTYYIYNRNQKTRKRFDYSDDLASARQGGFQVLASSYFPEYDTSSALRLKDLKFFNICLTDTDVAAMYNTMMYNQA